MRGNVCVGVLLPACHRNFITNPAPFSATSHQPRPGCDDTGRYCFSHPAAPSPDVLARFLPREEAVFIGAFLPREEVGFAGAFLPREEANLTGCFLFALVFCSSLGRKRLTFEGRANIFSSPSLLPPWLSSSNSSSGGEVAAPGTEGRLPGSGFGPVKPPATVMNGAGAGAWLAGPMDFPDYPGSDR